MIDWRWLRASWGAGLGGRPGWVLVIILFPSLEGVPEGSLLKGYHLDYHRFDGGFSLDFRKVSY